MGVTHTGKRAKSYTRHRRARDRAREREGPVSEVVTRWVPPRELRAAQLEQLLREDPQVLDSLPSDVRRMLQMTVLSGSLVEPHDVTSI